MTSVCIKDLKGKDIREKELSGGVFAIEPKMHLVHLALTRQLANGRSGCASTKTRAEVRGGGRKPWRQKGTGRARAGSIRSPLWNGGGVIFGPKPRDYSLSMTKKARHLALGSALAARKNDLVLITNFEGLFKTPPQAGGLEQPKTKAMVAVLKSLGLSAKSTLIILDHKIPGASQVERAARNIASVRVVNFSNLSIKDLAQYDALLTTEHVLGQIESYFQSCVSQVPAGSSSEAGTEPCENVQKEAPELDKKTSKKPAAKIASKEVMSQGTAKTPAKKTSKAADKISSSKEGKSKEGEKK